MRKTGIFYGSATGTTANVAKRIASLLGVAGNDVHDVADTAPSKVAHGGVVSLRMIGSISLPELRPLI